MSAFSQYLRLRSRRTAAMLAVVVALVGLGVGLSASPAAAATSYGTSNTATDYNVIPMYDAYVTLRTNVVVATGTLREVTSLSVQQRGWFRSYSRGTLKAGSRTCRTGIVIQNDNTTYYHLTGCYAHVGEWVKLSFTSSGKYTVVQYKLH